MRSRQAKKNKGPKKRTEICMIAAMAKGSRIIGKPEGGLPWPKLKEDLAYFKKTTMGHPVIMGRVTWEEFGGKALPGRTSIVLTTQKDYKVPEGVHVADTKERALAIAAKSKGGTEKIFIIGGEQGYQVFEKMADKIYLTVVDFPQITEGPKFPKLSNYYTWKVRESYEPREGVPGFFIHESRENKGPLVH